jgi:hypothetical protein
MLAITILRYLKPEMARIIETSELINRELNLAKLIFL